MRVTLPGILGSRTIEPQSAESMNTNDGDVQSFPDQKLQANRSITRIETHSSKSVNAKQSAVKCSTARIIQINDRPGPLLVHLNQIQLSRFENQDAAETCHQETTYGEFM